MKIHHALKTFAKRQYEQSIHLRPVFRQPYASHLPVLFAVACLIRPRNILEYGSGVHSTCAFLSKSAFPDLQRIKSFENDRSWYAQMRDSLDDEKRLTLEFVDGLVAKAVSRRDLEQADMVFIDDSINLERALTIKAVAMMKVNQTPIIIHDVHIRQYRFPIRRFTHQFIFDALNPQTGVVWNGDWPLGRYLPIFNDIIAHNGELIEAGDAARWIPLFRAVLDSDLPTETTDSEVAKVVRS